MPHLRSDPTFALRCVLGASLCVALAWLLLVGGIGLYVDFTCDVYPVTGSVLVDGRVPVGARLELYRYNSDQWIAATPTATVGADGLFEVTSIGDRLGAPAGDYIVTVRWTPEQLGTEGIEPGPNLLPLRYALASTSPLRITVAPGANKLQPIAISCRCTDALAVLEPAGA